MGGRAAEIPRYADALLAELALRPASGQLATIYFGGGTPSLLPAAAVARVVDAGVERWGNAPSEVTLEANPSRREAPDWAGLRAAGVNRVSLGIQSLHDAELVTLARGQTAAEGLAAFAAARAAGLQNISVDLIYGIPDQSLAEWRDGLARALALGPDHLSLYALQLALAPDEWAAPPRRGALRWRQRMAPRQDDGLAAAQYELAEEILEGAGYHHYELSSWARPGCESRHNSAYWERRPYTGIGAGAHSYDGATRSWNARDLDRYLTETESGLRATSGSEHLDEVTRAFEAVALGLRLIAGLSRAAFAAEFGDDPLDRYPTAVEEGIAADLIEVADDMIRLTRRGRLFANDALIAFAPSR